ncbi:MAG: LysE family transporter [Planctomycetota bacterium]
MSLPFLFGIAFVTALSGALMPGPVLFATVRWSARHGRWVGPIVVLGHALVEVPLMAAIILGLGGLLARDSFVGGVGVAGGAALLMMGATMLRTAPRVTLPGRTGDDGDGPLGVLRVLGSGVVTSIANPYFVLWWATVGLNFLAQAKPFGARGYAVFYAGHVLADLAWYGAVSESVHHGRRLLSDRTYRRLVGGCAALLICFAAYFAWRGCLLLRGA